jgi:hypothetical protein
MAKKRHSFMHNKEANLNKQAGGKQPGFKKKGKKK